MFGGLLAREPIPRRSKTARGRRGARPRPDPGAFLAHARPWAQTGPAMAQEGPDRPTPLATTDHDTGGLEAAARLRVRERMLALAHRKRHVPRYRSLVLHWLGRCFRRPRPAAVAPLPAVEPGQVSISFARMGIAVTVVVPETAPEIKRQGIATLGARVVVSGACSNEAEAEARRLAADTDAVFVSPFDDDAIIEGNGTSLAAELLRQVPDMAHEAIRRR
jgi:hypothetical protein